MSDNLSIWNALSKTDPKHTKQFKRPGGFSGTAIKPIWSIKMMTELFGPCGSGWGMTEPSFNVQNGDGEMLVYCTVGLWHGERQNLVYGVGGDKVVEKRNSGDKFNRDEAFKSAYTDALSNAMKMIGVGADVHMGLFDDHKYVREMEKEFAGEVTSEPAQPAKQPTGPKAAPVPAGEQEWHDLAARIRNDIDTANTANRIGDILESRQLAEMTEHNPTTGKFLKDRATLRMGAIAQGKAA